MKNPFQDEIGASLRKISEANGAFYHARFYDKKSFHRHSPYTPRQPADYLAVHNGAVWLLECKSCHASSFPFKNIQEHQLAGLLRASAAGAAAVFLVCDRRRRRCFKAYAVSARKMAKLVFDSGRRSAKWDVLEMACDATLPREGELWDLNGLFGMIKWNKTTV